MADTTTNLSAPKPIAANQLSVDVERLRTALDTLDTAIAGKADTSALTAHIALKNPHGATAADIGAIPALSNAVTDTYLGNRTANPDLAPSGSVGNLTQWVSWFANRIKAITGKSSWLDAPDTTLKAAASHIGNSSNPHGTTATQVGALANVANVVNDTLIGNRTINQALASPANTGTLTQIVSWFAGRLVAITGRTNWFDAPATTLANAATHISNTSNPHSTTASQVATASGFGAGAWNISISGVAATASACTGNAATSTKLATARTINGVSFDGTANIEIPVLKSLQTVNLDGSGITALSSGGDFGGGGRYRDYTITAVTPGKCMLNIVSTSGESNGIRAERSGALADTKISLVNATTLRLSIDNTNASTWTIMGSVQVIEFG